MRRMKLAPAIAAMTLMFLLAPFVVVVGASFDSGDRFAVRFPPHSLSLDNYRAIPWKYLDALQTSLILGVIVAVLATVLGLLASIGLVRSQVMGKDILQSFFRLPVQIPLIVSGAVFLQFYYQVDAVLGFNPSNSLAGLVLAHLFVALPYSIGAISAVLARFDSGLEEAAESLGATRWNTFRRVTFPIIRPGILTGAFYAFVVSFGNVPISIFLATGKTTTLPVVMFQDLQMDHQPSILALSTIIVVISLLLIVGLHKLGGFDLFIPSGRKS
jgi:putative spermidine/putrescine transport system permease protein